MLFRDAQREICRSTSRQTASDIRMFAITTRNKLRSRRHAISMIWAWWHVRRQLARTPGMLLYSTAIPSLTEFFTLTLWEREMDMFLFMASDAHREMMWNFRRWSESFWSMRWNPAVDIQASPIVTDVSSVSSQQPSTAAAASFAHEQLSEPLASYLDRFEYRGVHASEPVTLDVNAVIGRVITPSPMAMRRLMRTVRPWRSAPDLQRFIVAIGWGECLLLAVWKQGVPEGSRALIEAVESAFPGAWLTRFQATDYEIGHWNRLRFREMAASIRDRNPAVA